MPLRTFAALLLLTAPFPLNAGWAPFDCGPAHDAALVAHRSAIEAQGYSVEFPILHAYPETREEVLENLRDQLERYESREHRGAYPNLLAIFENLRDEVERFLVGKRSRNLRGPRAEEEDVLTLWSDGELEFDVVPVENWSLTRCSTRAADVTMVYSIRAVAKDDRREVLRANVGRDGLLLHWRTSPKSVNARRPSRPFPEHSRLREALKALLRVEPGPTQYVLLTERGLECRDLFPCLAARLPEGTIAIESLEGEILLLDPTSRRHEVQIAPGDGRPSPTDIPGRYAMYLGPGTLVELRRADLPTD